MLSFAFLLTSCGERGGSDNSNGFIFNPVDSSSTTDSLMIPLGGQYQYQILYSEGDQVKVSWKNSMAAAKGGNDYLAFLPIGGASDHGILWVNHKTGAQHDLIGDGGGASVLEVFRDSLNNWSLVGFPYAINFDSVGGTLHNSLGVLTPWGTILSSEEIEPRSLQSSNGSGTEVAIRDTSDYLGEKRWKNFGWMVEIDPFKQKVLGKRKAMGRFMHEGNCAMPDGRTFYMMDDESPAAFFKFVADTAQNLNSGQLYAWRMNPDSTGRHWLPLSRGRDTLMNARDFAFRMGATMFNGLEDIEMLKDGTFLISETGKDSADFQRGISMGGQLAAHLEPFHLGNGIYDDRHGRILRYDPKSEKMTTFLEGGAGTEDKSIELSNPDNLVIDEKRNMLVIFEDVNQHSRNPLSLVAQAPIFNEIYFLDLSIVSPKIDDLKRFAVLPEGAEPTGPAFSPDYNSLFFSIQFVKPGKRAPFNRSMTLVVSGFPE